VPQRQLLPLTSPYSFTTMLAIVVSAPAIDGVIDHNEVVDDLVNGKLLVF